PVAQFGNTLRFSVLQSSRPLLPENASRSLFNFMSREEVGRGQTSGEGNHVWSPGELQEFANGRTPHLLGATGEEAFPIHGSHTALNKHSQPILLCSHSHNGEV